MNDVLNSLVQSQTIWILIPVVAIIGSFVYKGMKLHYAHKERMAELEYETEE